MIQDGILDSVVYQQAGAPPHFAFSFSWDMDWLCIAKTLGSPFARFDPNELFRLGFIKAKVNKVKINGFQQLKNRIFAAPEQIKPDMLARVFWGTKE